MVAGPILVLDDDEASRLAVAAVLEDEGYFVVGANNANAGLAALEEYRPALIMLGMQSDDGRVLIQDAIAQGLRFAVCVLGTSPQGSEWGAEIGAHYLTLPFEKEPLLATVYELAGPPE